MAKNTDTKESPKFDLTAAGLDQDAIVSEIAGMFHGFVSDITNPDFTKIVSDLAADSVRIGTMRAKGAKQALVDEAVAAVKARAASALQVPGLVAAGRQQQFLAFSGRILTGLIGMGFSALRSYSGVPSGSDTQA